ncbi:MAG: Vitamin B12 dependent methionine synthase activation subunit [Clostridia bacterium]|nr:Vitamin B12 dependent methionine synthase activation subunit [Clostridia bacterium]
MKEGLRLAELGTIPFDEKEILHYAMLPSFAPAPEELPLKESLEAARGAAQCRAVWCRYPLKRNGEELDLGFAKTTSQGLKRHLEGCDEIVLFACTAGAEMDRRISRAKLQSPAKGLLMHAIGAQQVEGACDRLCKELAEQFPDKQLTDRYSPGYGDLPLEMQRDVMNALDCGRTVGIILTDSLLMTPSKSVTAIIGMKERKPE